MAKYSTIEQLSHAVETLEGKVFTSHAHAETEKANLHERKAKGGNAWDKDGGDKPPQK